MQQAGELLGWLESIGGNMASRASQAKSVAIVASGNFLEMYDFQVFGFYAAAIGAAMFPKADPFAAAMSGLVTFGLGFVTRPLGALFLGAFLDKHGRRLGLLVTLGLMAVGTLTIALTPSYAAIGIGAPLLIPPAGSSRGCPPASSSAACRSTSPKSRRRAARASSSHGSPPASRWP
jgi:MFS family permease